MRINVTNKKRFGERLAAQHQSVNRGVPIARVYESLEKATQARPFQTQEQRSVSRIKAVLYALDRIENLGDRTSENFRIAVRDKLKINQEFDYLQERVAKLISDSIYATPLNIDDLASQTPIKNIDTLIHRMSQLMNAIYSGEYHIANNEQLSDFFRKISLDTFKGDIQNDLAIEFKGPAGLYTKGIPLVRTIMDIKEQLQDIAVDVRSTAGEDWLNAVTARTTSQIVNNPHRALATQIEGKNHTGRIVISL